MTKKVNTKKVATVQVEVKRTKKLTLQEINALVETTVDKIEKSIDSYNNSFKDSMEFKAELKAIKTKHGVLKAERCLIAFAQRHPKVEFIVVQSDECKNEISGLIKRYTKRRISNWETSKLIKNRLILEQADGAKSVFELAESIAQEYLTK